MQSEELEFERICREMEKALNRPLTPEERSAMRIAHGAVKPTPFIVNRSEDDREETPGGPTGASKAAD